MGALRPVGIVKNRAHAVRPYSADLGTYALTAGLRVGRRTLLRSGETGGTPVPLPDFPAIRHTGLGAGTGDGNRGGTDSPASGVFQL